MKPTIAKEVVLDALMMAVWRRKPTQEVIVHSVVLTLYSSTAGMFKLPIVSP
jgi:putative transposase